MSFICIRINWDMLSIFFKKQKFAIKLMVSHMRYKTEVMTWFKIWLKAFPEKYSIEQGPIVCNLSQYNK